jgi:hypothetical protein
LGDSEADLERTKEIKKTIEEIFKLGGNEKTVEVIKLLIFYNR